MQAANEKLRLTRLLEDSYSQVVEALKGVDHQQIIYTDGSWRVQDIVAHIAAWDEEVAFALEAYLRGGEYRITNFQPDEFNRQTVLKRRQSSTAEVYIWWEAVSVRLRLALGRLSPAHLEGHMLYPSGRKRGTPTSLIEELIEHRREHLRDILAALDKS